MKLIALFFGSYNPIHIGHLIIANYILEFTAINELWFIVSPHNPFKDKKTLISAKHRIEMVNRAIATTQRMKASDIEYTMPRPSYSIDTVTLLKKKYPDHIFHIVLGSDNISKLHKWKNFKKLLMKYKFLVYPRHGFPYSKANLPDIICSFMSSFHFINAPKIEISSTFIRNAISQERDLNFFLPGDVYKYISENNLFRKEFKQNTSKF